MTEILNYIGRLVERPEAGGSPIGFTNGLFIVALLLVIYLLFPSTKKKKESLPNFCASCQHLGRTSLFNDTEDCSKKCKYNPKFVDTAIKSLYQKKV